MAFRNRPAEVLPVSATTARLTQAFAADKGLTATTMSQSEGAHALAIGSILLLKIGNPAGVTYEYDDCAHGRRSRDPDCCRPARSGAGGRSTGA